MLTELKLSALRAVKIFGTAQPGETLRMEARTIARLGLSIQAEARAYVGERLVIKAELTLSGVAFKEPFAPLGSG